MLPRPRNRPPTPLGPWPRSARTRERRRLLWRPTAAISRGRLTCWLQRLELTWLTPPPEAPLILPSTSPKWAPTREQRLTLLLRLAPTRARLPCPLPPRLKAWLTSPIISHRW